MKNASMKKEDNVNLLQMTPEMEIHAQEYLEEN